ncbi:MAG: hypothetical protein AB1847_20625 [bacterium]
MPNKSLLSHQAVSINQVYSSHQASSISSENAGVAPIITISHPSAEKLTTPHRQVFLEGKIQAQNGLRRIVLNGQELFNRAELDLLIKKTWPDLKQGKQGSATQNRDLPRSQELSKVQTPSKMQQTLTSSLDKYTLYYLNQICPLKEGYNRLDLLAEDNQGHRAIRRIDIRSIQPEESSWSPGSPEGSVSDDGSPVSPASPVSPGNPASPGAESQHRMILALIPPAKKAAGNENLPAPSSKTDTAGKAGIVSAIDAAGAADMAGTTDVDLDASGTAHPANAANSAGVPHNGDDLSDYIYHRLNESFTRQARFRLVERDKLPWLLIEKVIQAQGTSQSISQGASQTVSQGASQTASRGINQAMTQQEIARQIGQFTPAEGVIFMEVEKQDNGIEILARLVNLTSVTLAFHKVFAPVSEPLSHQDFEELNTIISGLAMKFRDSLPLLTGTVLAREGSTIRVNLGSKKGILRGMWYNIINARGRGVLCRAVVEAVAKETSRARIIEGEKIGEIRPGCQVSTR